MKLGTLTRALLTSTAFVALTAMAADESITTAGTAGPVRTDTVGAAGLGADGTLTISGAGSIVGTGQIGIVVDPDATSSDVHRVVIENTTAATEVSSTTEDAINIAPQGGGANTSTSQVTINEGAVVTSGTTAHGIKFDDVAGAGNTVTIINSGSVTGTNSGVFFANGNAAPNAAAMTVTNNSTGTITGTAQAGVNIDDNDNAASTFTVTNSGTITSSGAAGIAIGASATTASTNGSIVNNSGGTISSTLAAGNGIDVANASNFDKITNAGTITGGTGGAAIEFNGANLTGASTTVSLDNSGTIGGSTTETGINLVGTAAFTKGITNSGTIRGSVDAIKAAGTAAFSGNGIVNTGTITGGTGAAIDLSGSTGTTIITNNGTITGEVKLGNGNGTTNLMTIGANASVTRSAATDSAILGKDGQVNVVTIGGASASVTGVIDLGTGNNVLNVNESFTTGGAIRDTDIVVAADKTLTVGHNLGDGTNKEITKLTLGAGSKIVLGDGVLVEINDGGGNDGYVFTATSEITTVLASGTDTADPTNNSNSRIEDGGASAASAIPLVNVQLSSNGGYIANGALFNVVSGGTGNAFAAVVDGTAVNSGNTATLTFTTQKDAGNDDLIVKATRTSLNTVVANINSTDAGKIAQNVGTAIETNAGTGGADYQAVVGVVGSLTTADAVNEALQRLAPDVNGSVTGATFSVQGATNSVMINRLAKLREGVADVQGAGYSAGHLDNGRAVWLQFYGNFADQSQRKGVIGYDADTYGVAFGSDWMMNDAWRLGIAAHAATTDTDSDHTGAKNTSDIDHYGVTLYGNVDMDEQLYFDGLLGYTHNRYDTKRRINFGGLDRTARGKFDGNQYNVQVGVGYKMRNEGWILTPNANFAYSHLNLDSYTETGAGAASLYVNGDHVDAAVLTGDLRLSYDHDTDRGKIVPTIHAGINYDFVGDEHKTNSRFTNAGTAAGAVFISKGAQPAKFGYQAGIAFTMHTDNAWEITAAYDYSGRSDFKAHSGMLNFRYNW